MVWGAIIGGLLTAGSAYYADKQQEEAAKQQLDALGQAQTDQERMFLMSQMSMAPWRETGSQALGMLRSIYGLQQPTYQLPPQQPMQQLPQQQMQQQYQLPQPQMTPADGRVKDAGFLGNIKSEGENVSVMQPDPTANWQIKESWTDEELQAFAESVEDGLTNKGKPKDWVKNAMPYADFYQWAEERGGIKDKGVLTEWAKDAIQDDTWRYYDTAQEMGYTKDSGRLRDFVAKNPTYFEQQQQFQAQTGGQIPEGYIPPVLNEDQIRAWAEEHGGISESGRIEDWARDAAQLGDYYEWAKSQGGVNKGGAVKDWVYNYVSDRVGVNPKKYDKEGYLEGVQDPNARQALGLPEIPQQPAMTGQYIPAPQVQGPEQAFEAFRNSPGYQFQLQEAQKGAKQALAARGMSTSGAEMTELMRLAQGQAEQQWGNYVQGLQSLAGLSQGPMMSQAQQQMSYGGMLGQNAMMQGQTQAQQAINRGNLVSSTLGQVAQLAGQYQGQQTQPPPPQDPPKSGYGSGYGYTGQPGYDESGRPIMDLP